MKQTTRIVGLGCAALFALFMAAAILGYPPVWDLLFGIAYCLDGYGGCPWQ
jgi:hypothetical protein